MLKKPWDAQTCLLIFFYFFNDQTWSTIEVHPAKKDDFASNWHWRIHDQNSSGRSALVSMLIQDDFPAPEALTVILPLLSQSNLLKAALVRPSAIINIISFLHLKETQHYVRSSLVVPPNKKKTILRSLSRLISAEAGKKHLEHMGLLENRLRIVTYFPHQMRSRSISTRLDKSEKSYSRTLV